MKLKYFFPTLIVMLAMLASCEKDDEKTFLDGLRVSKSYVALDSIGTPVKVKVSAAANWAFEKAFTKITDNGDGTKDTTKVETPDWLTIDIVSGPAGDTEITFSGSATTESHDAELKIISGGKAQIINVIQTVSKQELPLSTCADVIAGPESKTYRVKGAVAKIANTTYGNWYLKDETGEVYVYGTLDAKGATKNFLSLGLEVGDIVTVEGPKTVYNGTVELVDVTVVDIEKSLIKVDSLSIASGELPFEGGLVTAYVSCKGNGFSVEVPEDAQDWLSIASMTPNSVTFRVLPNDAGGRKTTIAFTTTDGTKQYTSEVTISQKAFILPHGENPTDPFNVAEAIAKCEEIGSTTDGVTYYAKGIISSIASIDTGQYGNAEFNISADGTEDGAVLKVYRCYFLNSEKFTAEDQIAVGDEVIICGQLKNYTKDGVSTPEFDAKCYVYSIKKGNTPDPGTLENPFTIAQALEAAGKLEDKAVSEEDYYIKGKISSIIYTFSADYGTARFNISDDGATEGEQFLIYGTYYLGNRPWAEGDTQIVVGDEVVICGKLTNYNGTLETANKKNYIYSLNGKTE